jgi:hypothetical protein
MDWRANQTGQAAAQYHLAEPKDLNRTRQAGRLEWQKTVATDRGTLAAWPWAVAASGCEPKPLPKASFKWT